MDAISSAGQFLKNNTTPILVGLGGILVITGVVTYQVGLFPPAVAAILETVGAVTTVAFSIFQPALTYNASTGKIEPSVKTNAGGVVLTLKGEKLPPKAPKATAPQVTTVDVDPHVPQRDLSQYPHCLYHP